MYELFPIFAYPSRKLSMFEELQQNKFMCHRTFIGRTILMPRFLDVSQSFSLIVVCVLEYVFYFQLEFSFGFPWLFQDWKIQH